MRSRATRRALACLVVALVALVVGLLVGGAPSAGAHATLIGTVPAADGMVDEVPAAVELRFDEPVETTEGAVQVFDPGGNRADLGTVEADDGGATLRVPIEGDEQGTYTVAWRVTSEDSHTLTGSFVFHNGTPTGAVDVGDGGGSAAIDLAGAAGRWLGYAGTLLAVGTAALALLLSRPRSSAAGGATRGGPDGGPARGEGGSDDRPLAAGPAGRPGAGDQRGDQGGGDPEGGQPARGGAATLVGAAAGTEGPGTTLDASADEATNLLAGDPTAPGGTRRSSAAALAELRTLAMGSALAGAVGAVVALVATVAESTGRGLVDAATIVPDVALDTRTGQLAVWRIGLGLAAVAAAAIGPLWRRSPLPVLVLGAAALAVSSVAGHAWTAPDRAVAVASDLAHMGAVAVWVGGLVALLVALPLLPTPADRLRLATRFSGLAVGAVVVVALSGTVSGWQQVGSVEGLFSTTYGRLVLAKVAGFGGLVAIGWGNRARLVPLVARSLAPLQRSLRFETLLAALVLAVTAALVQQPPARTEVGAGPVDLTATAAGGQVATATVDPATRGPNDIHLYFYGPSGTEPLPVDAVQVTAGTAGVPPRRLQVTPITTNHVTVAGASLPSAGTWTVEVTAVQAGQPLVFTFEVPIA